MKKLHTPTKEQLDSLTESDWLTISIALTEYGDQCFAESSFTTNREDEEQMREDGREAHRVYRKLNGIPEPEPTGTPVSLLIKKPHEHTN